MKVYMDGQGELRVVLFTQSFGRWYCFIEDETGARIGYLSRQWQCIGDL